jgi:hypothetical protein
MEAVCTLLDEPVDWESAKRLLSSATFVTSLTKFDKDSVTDKTIKKLAKYGPSRFFLASRRIKQ